MSKQDGVKLALVNVWQFPAQTPHFGLVSLAAYVRQEVEGVEMKIIEGLDPVKEVQRYRPDIVCFTSDTLVYTKTLGQAKRLRKKLKAPFLLGGEIGRAHV